MVRAMFQVESAQRDNQTGKTGHSSSMTGLAESKNGTGREATSNVREPSGYRGKLFEWLLIAIAVAYAAGLLLAPLVAIIVGAFGEGLRAAVKEISSTDAISSLKLTLVMAVGGTGVDTVFGGWLAWGLVGGNFFGRGSLNGLHGMSFVVLS